MILTTHQKFALGVLRKLGCIRQRQLHVLARERFRQADLEITLVRLDAMLRQLRMGTADVRMDDELVWLSGHEPDYRRLEAIDVMIELTKGKPQNFSAKPEPPCLLRFAFGKSNDLKLFTVASADISPPELLEQARKERVIWISDGGAPPKGLTLPPKHFFAARQSDGSHRFYGSNGP